MADTTPLRPDIEAAAARMSSKIGAKREIRKLIDYLWEGETVEHMSSGQYGPGMGLVVMTDRRLMFVMDGWVNKTTDDFPFDKISSVQWSVGAVSTKLTIFASGNKVEMKSVADGKMIADALRERIASGPAPVSASAPTAVVGEDVFETLRKLGELRDLGVVTPEEFEVKKAELLKRI